MTARFLALLLGAAPVAAVAQTTPVSAVESVPQGHVLEIRDGHVLLDSVVLADAAPDGLDLTGLTVALEYSGPITPIVEVDGQAYVLEGRRLVRFEDSTRAGERVYVLRAAQPDGMLDGMPVGAMDDDRLALVSEEAYLRELAERDRALYERMQNERALERHVDDLAQRVRRAPVGPERAQLRETLRGRLSDLFGLKQQIRREEVSRAQAELDTVRGLLDERDAQHHAIVDERLRGLCGD